MAKLMLNTILLLKGGVLKGHLWATHKDFTLDTAVTENRKLGMLYLIEF